MNMKYLKKRYLTYWYQRAIPKRFEAALGSTGTFSQNLQTHVLSVAVKMVEDINTQWDALDAGGGVRPYIAYAQALKTVTAYPESLSDELSSVAPSEQAALFASYTEFEQIAYRAAQEKLGGQQRKEEFAFSLMDAHEAYRERKTNSVTAHTMSKYNRAIRVYLGNRVDVSLASITYKDVADWLDTLTDITSYGTRSDYLSYLGQVYQRAQRRELIPTTGVNPFRDQQHGKKDVSSYQFMSDATLAAVLDLLDSKDRLPAIVARYSGMRLSEIFTSKLEQVDDVWCLTVEQGKTAAAARSVPIRLEILEVVKQQHAKWRDHVSYSKRFGRAKAKVIGKADRTVAFHSLRVSFITYAARAGYAEHQVAWLVGHETGKGKTMSFGLYFSGFTLDKLAEIVEAVPSFNY